MATKQAIMFKGQHLEFRYVYPQKVQSVVLWEGGRTFGKWRPGGRKSGHGSRAGRRYRESCYPSIFPATMR